MKFTYIIDNFAIINKLDIVPLKIKNFIAYKIPYKNLLILLKFVKESKELRFTILTDLFATDFLARSNRFEIVYSLLSLKLNARLIFKIEISEHCSIPSIVKLFSSACWYEREIFDMFGVDFSGSPDLRRILTDYNFNGHPLRKDFPLSGHVEMRYDKDLEKLVYEPVLLNQEFRNFDFSSPWKGPEKTTFTKK